MSRVLDLFAAAHGQCRLVFVSATSIRLDPHNGRNLAIAGLLQQLPAAGVSISNAGLSANTVYYVYARMNAGAMALELSTTGHSVDAATGVHIKTGDATRTLVGMIATNGSSQFQDGTDLAGVLSYFNRRRKTVNRWFTAARTLSATTATEFDAEIRVKFISWADEQPVMRANGGIYAQTAGPAYAYIGVDTNSQSDSGGGIGASGTQAPFSAEWATGGTGALAENAIHFASLYGIAAAGGTVTMTGNATQAAGQRTSLFVAVMG